MLKILLSLLMFYVLMFTASCVHQNKVPAFSWPLKNPVPISRRFSIYHDGLDFPKKRGYPVLAVHDGQVVYAGSQFSGYGKLIVIKHPKMWASLYAHLHRIDVKKGDKVTKGSQIGLVGNTGRSSGPHLHFELLYNKQPMNPITYMPLK